MTYVITNDGDAVERCETLAEIGSYLLSYDHQAFGVSLENGAFTPWQKSHYGGKAKRLLSYASDTMRGALENVANNVADFGDTHDWRDESDITRDELEQWAQSHNCGLVVAEACHALASSTLSPDRLYDGDGESDAVEQWVLGNWPEGETEVHWGDEVITKP